MSLTAKSIPSLLVLCKKGNAAAQLEVYNRYQRAMYNTALRIVKDTAEAEDVMQESFITAFNKLETLQKPSTFGAWLKRIVVNNSITSYYKNKRFVAWDETNYMHVVDGAPGVDSGEK
ncbi:MAG: RNA polymerase sigma factor, partial [Marinirhabdus sp.]